MGPGGAVGLNLLAVDKAMDYYGVAEDERLEFAAKVKTITSLVLSISYREQEAKREASMKKK